MGRTKQYLCPALALCYCGWTPTVQAEDNLAAAAAAYQRAQSAELRRDYVRAATLYELADRIAPAAPALRGSIRMRRAAGHLAAAATQAQWLMLRHPDDASAQSYGQRSLSQLGPQLLRLTVACASPCRVSVDGRLSGLSARLSHTLYLQPGRRQILARFASGGSAPRTVHGGKGARLALRFSVPISNRPSKGRVDSTIANQGVSGRRAAHGKRRQPADGSSTKQGLSPWFFGSAAAATLALAAVALWSGLDVLDAHESYDREAADAQRRYDDGRQREGRTNLFIGLTAAAAGATAVLALFTNWSGERQQVQLAPAPAGLSAGYALAW